MFTHRCFIRKNTEELRDKLRSLGYVICTCATMDSLSDGLYTFNGVVHSWFSDSKPTDSVDCFDNEELFLAVAAVRDDSEADQYYTDGRIWEKTIYNEPSIHMKAYGWKATLSELLKHFIRLE